MVEQIFPQRQLRVKLNLYEIYIEAVQKHQRNLISAYFHVHF